MNVSGLSIMTRKTLVVRRFGLDAWSQFYRDVASTHRCLGSLITAETPVPLDAFLAFHDELMRRFFKGEEHAYSKLGREASRWAVRDGPLKSLLDTETFQSVVASLPKFHGQYFRETSTWSEAAVTPEGISFRVHDLPQWHPYFEHFVVGYIAEILEMFCANPIHAVRLEGGSGKEYHYLLHGGPGDEAADTIERKARKASGKKVDQLSERELEVLVLVAHGRTNEEIGEALGISRKTAQHHVANAYRKLAVSGRVEATVWLMERGLSGN